MTYKTFINFFCSMNDDNAPSQSSVWNDTFWDNVQNISQLDGSWDVEGSY